MNSTNTESSRWAHILADECFHLLEKIAVELAKANGAKLPPKLSVVTPARCLKKNPLIDNVTGRA